MDTSRNTVWLVREALAKAGPWGRLLLHMRAGACSSSPISRIWRRRAHFCHLAPLWRIDSVVDSKRPFGGPEQVLRYLSRYTDRVTISDHRLVAADDHVAFTWKGYRDRSRIKLMTLSPAELIRRFLLHVLIGGFQRIRHYGFLANGNREAKLTRTRQLMPAPAQRKPTSATQGANTATIDGVTSNPSLTVKLIFCA